MSSKKKIFFDLETSGLHQGEISIFAGHSGPPKTSFIRFLPIEKEKGNYVVHMPLEMGDEITKKGICAIQEMLDKMKKEGFDVSSLEAKRIVTKYERLGDTVFPVNYHPNGMVTIDYPQPPFCEQIKIKYFDK